ncbi:MAG: hypothetical protein PWP65_991 [Clostridia bacterium]|nr:hypothetical protein [Clostridia bacterium]
MKLKEVQRILEAEVLYGSEFLEEEVQAGFGCDLMSDVLAFAAGKVLLLTGLTNSHVIRTAEIIDAGAIVFVRGKRPDKTVVAAAREKKIPLLCTHLLLYESCGRLYRAGLPGPSRRRG